MNKIVLLLSMPGGSEWVLIMVFFVFAILAPVLAIVYYGQVQRLKKENAALRDQLNKK